MQRLLSEKPTHPKNGDHYKPLKQDFTYEFRFGRWIKLK